MDFEGLLTALYAYDIDWHTSEANTTQNFELSTFDIDRPAVNNSPRSNR
jgi:hypothetical protein